MSKQINREQNRILEIHAGWLWGEGRYEDAMNCFTQSRHDRRDKMGRINAPRNKKGQFTKD